MAALTLDGLDIRSRSTIYLELMRGYFEPPSVRGEDIIIPGADGRTTRTRRADQRYVLLEGYVTGSSAANWNTNVAALMAKLDGSLVNLVVADNYLGSTGTHTLAVRCVSPPVGGEPTYGVLYQAWSVELLSVSPDWS